MYTPCSFISWSSLGTGSANRAPWAPLLAEGLAFQAKCLARLERAPDFAVVDHNGAVVTLPDVLAGHRDAIRCYVLSIVRDPDEADDLAQDALLRAHCALPGLKDHSRLTS